MPYCFAAGDEAGQTGFKFERGSTPLFAITLVLTNEPQAIQDGMDLLRSLLRLPAGTEFKFHSTPHPSRLLFLERAAAWPMVVRALYIDKRLLPPGFSRLKNWEFYAFFVAELLDRLPVGELEQTSLILDEFGPSRLTLRAIRDNLRSRGLWEVLDRPVKNVAFRRSQSAALIQAADMMGGAIYRLLTDGDDTYYHLIQSKTLVWAYRSIKTNPPT